MASDRILNGCKEIAAYLNVSPRTVQRHVHSLPISRFGKAIIILESDLRIWVQKNSHIFFEKEK